MRLLNSAFALASLALVVGAQNDTLQNPRRSGYHHSEALSEHLQSQLQDSAAAAIGTLGSGSSLPLSSSSSSSSPSSSSVSGSLSPYGSSSSSQLYSSPVQSSPYSSNALSAAAAAAAANGQLNSNGFVPIAKPLIQDLYDLSSSASSDTRYSAYPSDIENGTSSMQDQFESHRYFPVGASASFGSMGSSSTPMKSESDMFKDFAQYTSSPQASSLEQYFNENRHRMPAESQQSQINYPAPDDSNDVSDNDSSSYPKENGGYLSGKYNRPPYSTLYNDDNESMNMNNMMKNMQQSSSNDENKAISEQEMQNLLQQFAAQNGQNGQENFGQQFNGFSDASAMPAPAGSMPEIGGIAGFQPAPEGGQLPAPPGYKHVGYITIPAGAANMASMSAQASNGLPVIRPIPVNDSKNNKPKTENKKNGDSKQKPVRSLLSRLNPLNVLRRLRQRRERRQTNDISATDYLPLSQKYSYGFGAPSATSGAYSMPYGFGSMSGLGGMSGLGSLYSQPSAASSASSMFAMPSYGSYGYPYSAYASYMTPTGAASVPYGMPASAASTSASATPAVAADATKNTGDLASSASSVTPTGMMAPQMSAMGMGAMMPMGLSGMGMSGMAPAMSPAMSPYGAYGAYPAMGSMPMASMAMPFQYPGMTGMPGMQAAGAQGSTDASSPQGQTLPGGINLNDLLKDDEDEEPTRFRKFLNYINPVNMFRRFRNQTSPNDDRRRTGRFRRSVPLFPINRRSDEVTMGDLNDSEALADDDDNDDREHEYMSAKESVPKAIHGAVTIRKSHKRTKANLMGSRNFEILRGGAFQPEETAKLSQQAERLEYEPVNNYGNSEHSSHALRHRHHHHHQQAPQPHSLHHQLEDETFNNDEPEILGFQGFNGFSPIYNTLATDPRPTVVRLTKRIGAIENASVRNGASDLKATS